MLTCSRMSSRISDAHLANFLTSKEVSGVVRKAGVTADADLRFYGANDTCR